MRLFSGMGKKRPCRHTETVEIEGLRLIKPFETHHYVRGTHTNCEKCGMHLDWQPEKGKSRDAEIELYERLPKKGWNLQD